MPSRPGRRGRKSAADAHADTDGDRQRQAAGELSDRAAESVGRRYDATKEIHLGDRARERPDDGPSDVAEDESAAEPDGDPADADDRTATE